MRVAIIADIHGNLVALEAVLADLAKAPADRLVCLGDVAADGPQPREVVARLRELGCPVVMGNADTELISPSEKPITNENQRRFVEMERWNIEQLSPTDLDDIRTFQPTVTVALGDGMSLLCFHGTPRSNTEIMTAKTPTEELDEMLAGFTATVMAGGHTHNPLLRRHRDLIIINPGSVGMPFDLVPPTAETRNPARAEYALIVAEDGRLSIDFRRVPLDLDAVRRAARESGMPHATWWADGWQ